MSAKTVVRLVSILLSVIGVSLLSAAILISLYDSRRRKTCTQPVQAEIVEIRRHDRRDMDGNRMVSWYPVYEYTVNGRKIQSVSTVGGKEDRYAVGQRATVYTDPEQPEKFYNPADTGVLRWIRNLFAGIGAVLLAAGLCVGFGFGKKF